MPDTRPTPRQQSILDAMRGGAALRRWEVGDEVVATRVNGLPGTVSDGTVSGLLVARWVKRTGTIRVARGQRIAVYEITEAGRRASARRDGGF